MDLKKLAGTLLSSDSIKGLSNVADASGSDVTKVLKEAIPTLLNGAKEQAKDKKTADSFVSALAQHAKDDTKDLNKFMGNVDLKDGSKILTHLLGSDKDNVLDNIAEKTGVSKKKTNNILSAIAPLLLSLLGQQKDEDEDKDSGIENLLGSLLGNVDVGDVLTGLLSGNSKDDDDDKDDKKKDSGNLLGNILQNLLT